MALGILVIFVINKLTQVGVPDIFGFVNPETGSNSLEYSAILILALTFAGLVMLYQVCRPFNTVRATLFVLCAALAIVVVTVPHLGDIMIMKSIVEDGPSWSKVHFNLQQILLLIIIVQAAFPLSNFLIKVFDMMNPLDEDEEKDDQKTSAPQQTTAQKQS
jgi:hypothetical protein